ncbi:MAG: hypothetical protein IJQ52_02590 [Bacteroidales bacterium]|nr:hypothetical protein [Bacteroidales bacterium]
MKLTKKQIDDLNVQVTMEIKAEDYQPAEKKRLSERRRTADFKGFRKGMAPMSLIQRVYGEQALAEAVNDVISEGLNDFLKKSKLRVVGEPLASEDQPENEWVSGKDFTFKFDVAQTPEITLTLSKDDKVTLYNIEVTEKAKKEMKENMLRQAGEMKENDKGEKELVPAEPGKEAYDRLFGPDKVHDEKEFDAAVAEHLTSNYEQEADYRLSKDIREYLVEKAALQLPEAFLKRWLIKVNEGKFSAEDVEKEFDMFLKDFRWQLVREHLMKEYKLKVEAKDIQEAAESYVAYQYAMYGIGNVPADMLKEAAQRVLADERQGRQIEEGVEDQKVLAAVKDVITISKKKITVEKFRAL